MSRIVYSGPVFAWRSSSCLVSLLSKIEVDCMISIYLFSCQLYFSLKLLYTFLTLVYLFDSGEAPSADSRSVRGEQGLVVLAGTVHVDHLPRHPHRGHPDRWRPYFIVSMLALPPQPPDVPFLVKLVNWHSMHIHAHGTRVWSTQPLSSGSSSVARLNRYDARCLKRGPASNSILLIERV